MLLQAKTQKGTNAGAYTLSITSLDNKNYTLSNADGLLTQTLTITQKQVVVELVPPTDLEADGETKEFSVVVNGNLTSDAIGAEYILKRDGVKVNNNDTALAGTYTVEFVGLTGAKAGNYVYSGETVLGAFEVVEPAIEEPLE